MEENTVLKEIEEKLKGLEHILRPGADVILDPKIEEICNLLKDPSITDEQRKVKEEKIAEIRKKNSKNSNGTTGSCDPKLLKK